MEYELEYTVTYELEYTVIFLTQPMDGESRRRPGSQLFSNRPWLWGVIVFVAAVGLGLYYVKWMPYFNRAFVAATHHSIGASILTGKDTAPPAVGWQAAWSYTIAYFKSVWQAVILGLLIGSGVQALLPCSWLMRVLGHPRFASTAIAGLASVPSMM